MNFVRFTASFTFTDAKTGARTRFPLNWGGEVPAEIEKAAKEAGALALTIDDLADTLAPVNPGVTPAASFTDTGAVGAVGLTEEEQAPRRTRSTPAAAEEGKDAKAIPSGKDGATSERGAQAAKA